MNRQPVFIMLLCFVSGIFLSDALSKAAISYAAGFAVLLLLFFPLFFSNRVLIKMKTTLLGTSFLWIGFFLHSRTLAEGGMLVPEGKRWAVFELGKKLKVDTAYRRYEAWILKLEDRPLSQPFKVVLQSPREFPELDFVHYYKAPLNLRRVRPPENDFQFNYARYLARRGIFCQAFVSDEVAGAPKEKFSPADRIRQKRLEVLQKIDAAALSLSSKSFLKGIVLADRTAMDAAMVQDFRRSGLVHLLAISGTHFAIIFGALLWLLKLLLPFKDRRYSILTALVLIWGFAVFIDYGNSVVRSCLMITAYYLSVLLQRKPDLLHAMSLAAFAILLADTRQLFEVGFQLSFLAVMGIYAFNAPLVKMLLVNYNPVYRFFVNVITISISAQWATLPLVLYYFHQYSFLSLAANLVVLPFAEIIIIFSLVMSSVLAMGLAFPMLFLLYEALVDALLKVIHFFADQHWAFEENIPFGFSEMLIVLVGLFFLRQLLWRPGSGAAVRVLVTLLVFAGWRLLLFLEAYHKNETFLMEAFRQKIVVVKRQNHAVFWLQKPEDITRIEHYVIHPYITSRRIKDFAIKYLPEGAETFKVDHEEFRLK